jgi:RNA polymerase sigma-70 factor (ECF subfamily)
LQFENFDAGYLQSLRSGDFRAEQHFVNYFSELIHLKLRSRLNSPQAIEDVRQETFARVFKAIRNEGVKQPERLGAFVIAICRNVLMEYRRAGSRENPLDEEDSGDTFPDSKPDALSGMISTQSCELVRGILEELPERDRRLLKAIFFDEQDKDEVCRDFGVDRDYLRVLLHRAKQSFKSKYLKEKTESKGNGASAGQIAN